MGLGSPAHPEQDPSWVWGASSRAGQAPPGPSLPTGLTTTSWRPSAASPWSTTWRAPWTSKMLRHLAVSSPCPCTAQSGVGASAYSSAPLPVLSPPLLSLLQSPRPQVWGGGCRPPPMEGEGGQGAPKGSSQDPQPGPDPPPLATRSPPAWTACCSVASSTRTTWWW